MGEEKKSEEIRMPQRTITINGFEKHIELKTEGYVHNLMIIMELQVAIDLIRQNMLKESKSNIVIPGTALPSKMTQ